MSNGTKMLPSCLAETCSFSRIYVDPNLQGLELSPFFVSVAQFKGKKTEFSQERILLNGCMLWRKTHAFHPNHLILFPFHVWYVLFCKAVSFSQLWKCNECFE
jgi:hypothetical protein